jgi:hypothetical protein
MAAGILPGDGEARVGGIALPAGRQVLTFDEDDEPLGPVAWVTGRTLADAGLVWLALSSVGEQTGLVPILLEDDEDEDDYFFEDQFELGGYTSSSERLEELAGEVILEARWQGNLPSEAEEADYPDFAARRAPFARSFPGLALAVSTGLGPERLGEVLVSLPAARIGLVAASRPADVLAKAGWSTFDDYLEYASLPQGPVSPAAWIGAVLRSWEDRFGARLLNVGPGAEIRLLVERPPADSESAQRVAAEHFAFADECDFLGHSDIAEIAAALVGAPIWQFWWD